MLPCASRSGRRRNVRRVLFLPSEIIAELEIAEPHPDIAELQALIAEAQQKKRVSMQKNPYPSEILDRVNL